MQNQENSGKVPGAQQGNDDYKRDGASLGSSSSGDTQRTSDSTQKGGGGSGYDAGREQQEINKEQEEMHQERDPNELNVERTQTPQPEVDPARENPAKEPGQQPQTNPGSGASQPTGRTQSGAWSQSSWDPNSQR